MGLLEPAIRPGRRRVLELLATAAFAAVVFLSVSVAVPQAVGADESYVVRSNSMSPAIGAGSVAYVSEVPAGRVATGDVITYRTDATDRRVTHRVVEVVESGGQRQFRTKGDANEDPDPDLVSPAQLVGRVAFHVPLIGYVVSFAGTALGTVALVVVPALLLAVTEAWDLLSASEVDGSIEEGETE